MPRILDWTLPGADEQPIYGSTHLPDLWPHQEPPAVLILCHGFKGYKDYGFFPQLADAAARHGLLAHRFNFSHSGMTPRVETFERPDLFERDTWSKQIHDLAAVSRASRGVGASGLPPCQGPQVWFGHSRGGVTAVLAAAGAFEPKFNPSGATVEQPPAGLILAATPHEACHLDAEQREVLRRDGCLESPSSRTGQRLRIGRAWLDEFNARPEAFDPLGTAGQVRCPILVLHGGADETVPVESAQRLAEAATPHARLEVIAGASHTFDSPNPLPLGDPPPPATRRLIELVGRFAVECARPPRR